MTHPVAQNAQPGAPEGDLQFASAVAGLGLLLKKSPYAGQLTYSDVLTWARAAKGQDTEGYRAEFIQLTEELATLATPIPTTVQ